MGLKRAVATGIVLATTIAPASEKKPWQMPPEVLIWATKSAWGRKGLKGFVTRHQAGLYEVWYDEANRQEQIDWAKYEAACDAFHAAHEARKLVVRGFFAEMFEAVPDFSMSVTDMVAYGEKAAVRWAALGDGPAPEPGVACRDSAGVPEPMTASLALVGLIGIGIAQLTTWLVGDGTLFRLPLWATLLLMLPGLPYAYGDIRARKAVAAAAE